MDRGQLLNLLIQRFNLDELEALCFRLNVPWEDLSGNTLNAKARALIEYMERRGHLDDLTDAVERVRSSQGLNTRGRDVTIKRGASPEVKAAIIGGIFLLVATALGFARQRWGSGAAVAPTSTPAITETVKVVTTVAPTQTSLPIATIVQASETPMPSVTAVVYTSTALPNLAVAAVLDTVTSMTMATVVATMTAEPTATSSANPCLAKIQTIRDRKVIPKSTLNGNPDRDPLQSGQEVIVIDVQTVVHTGENWYQIEGMDQRVLGFVKIDSVAFLQSGCPYFRDS